MAMHFTSAALAAAILLLVSPVAVPLRAADEPAGLVALAAELSLQQKLIAENQAKIDAALAVIQEELRQARIMVSRSGRKAATP